MVDDPQVRALLEELPRHIDAGRNERVADIHAELAELGYRSDNPSGQLETAQAAPPAEDAAAPVVPAPEPITPAPVAE
jgi:hypothetical protein